MRRWLTLLVGAERGRCWMLPEGRTVVGRGPDSDIIFDDSQVSRGHAALFVEGGVVILDDLGSTNGTQVNAARVLRAVVGVGDRIQIGHALLELGGDDADDGP